MSSAKESDIVEESRKAVLAAIDRRREDCKAATSVPSYECLGNATPRSLRRLASSLRSSAWNDRSESAEETEPVDDPAWAPSATLRIAALIDHLAELASPLGSPLGDELTVSQFTPSPNEVSPSAPQGRWEQISVAELRERFLGLTNQTDVHIFAEGRHLARATSWRGEVVEVVDSLLFSTDNSKQKEKKANLTKWGSALIRAGFRRPQLGPDLTAEFFSRHVEIKERLDVTVDVNAIADGLVHHIARVAPHTDFARAAITDLEIQRLADHKKDLWRSVCRAIERFPVKGPAWRAIGDADTTALLVARADQKGEKAPGADALLAHDFERALRRPRGVRLVLLTADNGLARTVAARLPQGTVWVGYNNPLTPEERFLSPMLAWAVKNPAQSRYSSLADLVDELFACSIAEDSLFLCDGQTTMEIRGYIKDEHQFVKDWIVPCLFVRSTPQNVDTVLSENRLQGVTTPNATTPLGTVVTNSPALAHMPQHWPLLPLDLTEPTHTSKHRVTPEQVAAVLTWFAETTKETLSQSEVPLENDAQRMSWGFLKAINLVSDDGRPQAREDLVKILKDGNIEALRAKILCFEPIFILLKTLENEPLKYDVAKEKSRLQKSLFSSAVSVATATGLVWRDAQTLGCGNAHISRGKFLQWLRDTLTERQRISEIARRAARELFLSPPRLTTALEVVLNESIFEGSRGGSTNQDGLDGKEIYIENHKIHVRPFHADNLVGLRALEVRP